MKAKNVVLVLAATGLISSQAFAADVGVKGVSAAKVETFTEADASTLFEQTGQPMEVASLTSKEMKETEGAYLANVAGAAIGLAGYGAFCTIGTGSCNLLGAASAAGMGAISPIRAATQVATTARAIWGFNASVANGTALGVGSHYGY